MKTRCLLILCFSCLAIFSLDAQFLGGHLNGQATPKAVEPTAITAGSLSGDVNLFSGTYSTSNTLGSVSCPSGLSYTATMSYNSSFTSGDNLPQNSGIPYGEGWNLDLPMITVSVEDFNKYTLWEAYQIGQGVWPDEKTRMYTCPEAREEGSLHWFAPTLSIPGVASGRMVYKYYKDNAHIFVLHKFERYIEVRFTGTDWEVILDDGTRYIFSATQVSHRNASNQRVSSDCYNENQANVTLPKLVLPKSDMLTWYCKEIFNRNLVGRINFRYEVFGEMDFHKVFKQPRFMQTMDSEWFALGTSTPSRPPLQKVYRDVILREINACSNEKLEFEHQSISTEEGENMLSLEDEGVTALDSLYYRKSVYDWGGTAGDFDDWNRYKHMRSKELRIGAPTAIPIYDMQSPTNPYRGLHSAGGSWDVYVRENADANEIPFNHGYLESPRLQPNSGNPNLALPPGDIYEVRSKIRSDEHNLMGNGGLFDIHLGTGDVSQGFDINPITIGGTAMEEVHASDYAKTRGEAVFSTFNQAVKWNNHAADEKWMTTSNFFVMPNLPTQYEGFNIQIGPGISDNDFTMTEGEIGLDGEGDDIPRTCLTYFNANDQYTGHPIKYGDDLPSNFGIGMPWGMMRDFYHTMENQNCSSLPFNSWWHGGISSFNWSNTPTKADDKVVLEKMELIRYSKNPYMLRSVKKKVWHAGTTAPVGPIDGEEYYWLVVNHLTFRYDIVQTPLFVNVRDNITSNLSDVYTTGFNRNIVRLRQIIQLPQQDSDVATADSPTTFLNYTNTGNVSTNYLPGILVEEDFEICNNNNFVLPYSDCALSSSQGYNASMAVLSEIVDPLGKVTTINYSDSGLQPQSYLKSRFSSLLRPSEYLSFLSEGNYFQAKPYGMQIYMVVDNITVEDRQGEKTWNYNFGDRKRTIGTNRPFFSENFIYDRHYDTEIGFESVEVEGPTGDGQSPRSVYHHHTSELLWGKLHRVENYDGNNQLMSKSESTYEASIAFEPATHRFDRWDVNMDYSEYNPWGNYYDNERPKIEDFASLTLYHNSLYNWMKTAVANPDYADWLNNEPTAPAIDCSKFEELTFEQRETCVIYWRDYWQWLAAQPNESTALVRSHHPDFTRYAGIYDTPQFYESRNHRLIHKQKENYLYSYFIKKTKDHQWVYDQVCPSGDISPHCVGNGTAAIETINEYQYFEAAYDGKVPVNSPYYSLAPELLAFTGGRLVWEPSWQLYSTKTYSPQLAGAYSLEENFYLYDQVNAFDVNTVSDYKPNQDQFRILWKIWKYDRARSIPIETRTTTKAPNDGEQTQSTYYLYRMDWENNEEPAIIENIENPNGVTWPCEDELPGGGTAPGCDLPIVAYSGVDPCVFGSTTGPPPGCSQYTCRHENSFYWWCTCEDVYEGPILNYTDIGDPYANPPSLAYLIDDLAGNVFLSSVVQQVEQGTGELMTFGLDAGGTFFQPIFPYDTLTVQTVLSRNEFGQVATEMNERFLVTKYDYSNIHIQQYPDCNEGQEITKRFYMHNNVGYPLSVTVGEGREDALTTQYEYYPNNTIKTVMDPNGMELYYVYDEYGRMNKAFRNGELLQSIGYSHWAGNMQDDFKSRTQQNFLHTINYIDEERKWETKAYVDPIGRSVASEKFSIDAAATLENNIYDIWDRPILKLKPDTEAPAVNEGGINPQEHAEFQYDTAPRSRPLKSSKYGESISGEHTVDFGYAIVGAQFLQDELTAADQDQIPPGSSFSRTVTRDEDLKKVVEYSNALGQKVATITNNGRVATVFKYNSQGQVKEVYNPEKILSEYFYNYLGQLYQKENPDGGTTYYAYDHSGLLIGEQHANNQVRAYRYDSYGRMLVQAGLQSAGTILEDNGMKWRSDRSYDFLNDLIDAESAKFEKQWYYENYNEDGLEQYLGNALPFLNGISYAKGRPVQTVSYDLEGKPIEYRFLSYNPEGFLKWEMIQFNASGISEESKGRLVRISYPKYNLQGSYETINVNLNGGDLSMQYRYKYDNWNRIKEVYANYGSPIGDDGCKVVDYEYDSVKGVVSNKRYYASPELEKGQTELPPGCKNRMVDQIGYDYDQRFRLTSIGSTLFSWDLTYDQNNGQFPDNYNGNINSSTATYNLADLEEPIEAFSGPTTYEYRYDNLNRLVQAEAEVIGDLDLSNQDVLGDVTFSYDKAGNIETLLRGEVQLVENQQDFVQLNNYQYTYASGSNRLKSITGSPDGTRQFAYDGSGNLKSDSGRKIETIVYGRAHLPWSIGKEDGGGTYLYDINDARIYKSTATGSEYYIRSASGQELAVYNIGANQLTWYVYGNERVAKIDNQTDLVFTEEEGEGKDPCDPNIPACSEEEIKLQLKSLESILKNGSDLARNGLQYPTELKRIRLCDSKEIHLLKEEIEKLYGNYVELQSTTLIGAGEMLAVTRNGQALEMSWEEIIDGRGEGGGIKIGDYQECEKHEKCYWETYQCTPEEITRQTESKQLLMRHMGELKLETLVFPTTLYLVAFCDSTRLYVLEQELVHLTGSYALIQEIELESLSQTFNTLYQGSLQALTVEQILSYRLTDDLLIDGYGCGIEIEGGEPECTYRLDQENWLFEPIVDSDEIEISFDRVVIKDCGNGPEEIVRERQSQTHDTDKKNLYYFPYGNALYINSYIETIRLTTDNPMGSIDVILNPSMVLSAYPGLAGTLNPDDLLHQGFWEPSFQNAIQIVIEHAIEQWRLNNGLGAVQYDLDIGSYSTFASIQFGVRHEPTTPYVSIDQDNANLIYVLADGSRQNGFTTTTSRNFLWLDTYESPCGTLQRSYRQNNHNVVEWRTITPPSVSPINLPYDPSRNPIINSRTCGGNNGEVRILNCDTPVGVWNGKSVERCDETTEGGNGTEGQTEPYVTPIPIKPSFYVHDHLGNTRILYHTTFKCGDIEVTYVPEHVADYFPYGKMLREYVSGAPEKFLTTHHERDVETGLDYRGARFYDSDVGRFLSLDPLAELGHNIPLTPYHYVANNPIMNVDPDGMDWYTNSDGEVIYDENVKSQDDLEEGATYLHANKFDRSVLDAIGAHIMNSGDEALNVFVSYFENENLGENYFVNAASQNYSTNAAGFMGVLTNMFDSVEDGILISQMTHDWVDNAGWTPGRNETEHGIGMFLMSEAHNSGTANIIGLANEVRGLLINDRQSGNMWNALLGRPTDNGGPTAFEWSDLKYNNKGLQFQYKYRNPKPSVNFDLSGFQ